MKAIGAQMVHQTVQIVGAGPGRRAWQIHGGAAESTPVICDEAEAGRDERVLLMLPDVAASRRRVQEDDGAAAALAVAVPQTDTGQFRVRFAYRRSTKGPASAETLIKEPTWRSGGTEERRLG